MMKWSIIYVTMNKQNYYSAIPSNFPDEFVDLLKWRSCGQWPEKFHGLAGCQQLYRYYYNRINGSKQKNLNVSILP